MEAWRALEHTVYNAPKNYQGEGTVESLLCARPGFHLDRTSTWGYSKLFYSPDSTSKAADLMLSVLNNIKATIILNMTWWISYVRVMLIKAMHCSMKYPKVMIVKTKRISGSRRSSSLNSFCRKTVYCLPGKNSPYLLADCRTFFGQYGRGKETL